MELSRVLIVDSSPEQFITLAEKDGPRSFAIKIGTAEAVAIDRRLRGEPPVRPQTHELVDSILRELGATVERIVIHRLEGGTYYASLYLRTADGVVEIDARPSDAIALALRAKAPIFAADDVIEASAIRMEEGEEDAAAAEPEQLVEDFKQFLEDVRPEDFGADG